MRHAIALLPLIFIVYCSSGQSDTSTLGKTTFTLKEAQEYAIANNPKVKEGKLEMNIARSKVKEVRAIGLPQVNLEGQFQNFLDIPTTVVPANAFNPNAPSDELVGLKFGTDYNMTGSVKVSQLIFDGSYLVGLQAAKAYPALQEKVNEKTMVDVNDGVASAYYGAVVAQEQIKVLEAMVKNTENLKYQTRLILENGLVDSTTYDQVALSYSNVRNMLRKAERDKELSMQFLKFQMGMDLDEEITLSQKVSDFMNEIPVESLMSENPFNPEEHPDHQVLQKQLELQILDVKNNKALYLPTLAAFFQHQQQALRNEFNFLNDGPWYPSTIWGITVQVPVFSSGMRKQQVTQSEIEVDKTQNNIEQLDQALQLEATQALTNFRSAYDSFLQAQESFRISGKILDRAGFKEETGVINRVEFTQTQNQHLETLGQYIMAMFEVLNAKAQVDKVFNTYTTTTTN